MIRCKFKCDSVEKSVQWDKNAAEMLFTAKMTAVYNNSPENADFWKWTPTGSFQVSCVKYDRFEPGKEYYLDISEAE